ncbi:MAG: sugar ABC transporter permease, partial [Flavobacteriaceae bacterium]|nr:sugar ABC transporter permease [Flavobacteriaceae bacterium]
DAKMGMANAMSYISIFLSIAFTFFFFYKLMEARKILSYD